MITFGNLHSRRSFVVEIPSNSDNCTFDSKSWATTHSTPKHPLVILLRLIAHPPQTKRWPLHVSNVFRGCMCVQKSHSDNCWPERNVFVECEFEDVFCPSSLIGNSWFAVVDNANANSHRKLSMYEHFPKSPGNHTAPGSVADAFNNKHRPSYVAGRFSRFSHLLWDDSTGYVAIMALLGRRRTRV